MGGAQAPALRLADEFFLVAHDHEGHRMRSRLQPVALAVGLASALLAELMFDGSIGQREGYLLGVRRGAQSSRRRGGDLVSAALVDEIGAKPAQPIPVWLGDLRHVATERVRSRLSAAGVLHEARVRKWWGGGGVEYQATDTNFALYPEARLYGVLGDRQSNDINVQEVTLAGLAEATGLLGKLSLWDNAGAVRERVAELRSALPEPLRGLLSHTETAVGAAMLSSRHH